MRLVLLNTYSTDQHFSESPSKREFLEPNDSGTHGTSYPSGMRITVPKALRSPAKEKILLASS